MLLKVTVIQYQNSRSNKTLLVVTVIQYQNTYYLRQHSLSNKTLVTCGKSHTVTKHISLEATTGTEMHKGGCDQSCFNGQLPCRMQQDEGRRLYGQVGVLQ